MVLASAVYYGLCLYPGIGGQINAGDSAKFQVLSLAPIMVHGPGYPLYLLLASGLRALALPLEGWWLVSFALSSLPAALANGVGFLLARRLAGNLWLGLAAALLLGGAHLMTVQATEAEVYGLNILFVLASVYLLTLFVESRRLGLFLAASAVYALAFGNHLMMVMLLPLFLGLALLHWRLVFRPLPVAAILGFMLVGASQYLYLHGVATDPATTYSEFLPLPPAPMQFIRYITGMEFNELYGSGLESVDNAEALAATLRRAHPWLSAPLIGLGALLFLWRLAARREGSWRGLAVTFAGALCFLPFVLWYGAWDIEAFHLPLLALALLASVVSLGWALRHRPAALGLLAVLLIAAGLYRAGQEAAALSERQPVFAGLPPEVAAMAREAAAMGPSAVLALSYELRMAMMYHEALGEQPAAAELRLAYQLPDDIERRSRLAGVAMPGNALEFVRLIRQARADMVCDTRRLSLPKRYRWPAFAFTCTAIGGA